MTLFQAAVLGVLQGLAEFLPISSSAHLTLAPWLLGWPDPGLGFDVALHVGTLVAVLWYFRAEWIRLAGAAIGILRDRGVRTPEQRRVVYLLIATVPAAVAGKLLEAKAEHAFRSPALIAMALAAVGVLLWIVDRIAAQRRAMDDMTWVDALLLGVAQIFALVPGVSRSGSTITAARSLRMTREAAAEFSFLMSMPIIAGAAALKVPKVLATEGLSAPLIVGVLASAISGWLAITVVLRYVTKHSYGVFAIYRVLAGLAVLALYYQRAGGR